MSFHKIKIIHYITTIPFCLLMFVFGYGQIFQNNPEFIKEIEHLGYPLNFLELLGVSKILGAIVLLYPRHTMFKEWAYAGFVFTLIGASYAQSMVGVIPMFQIILLLVVFISLITSRKLALVVK